MSLIPVGHINYPAYFQETMQSCTLDAVEEHIAFVIKVPKTGTLKKIGWRVNASTSPVGHTVRVSLETVADTIGVPVATTRAGATLYAAGAESEEINNPAAGARFDAINGTTGISVTKGDLMAVVIRCTGATSGSIGVAWSQYSAGMALLGAVSVPYTYTYINSTALLGYYPALTLEYDGEFVITSYTSPVYSTPLAAQSWSSTSNPDRRGLKFRLPYKCTARGCIVFCDTDVDVDVLLYDADEYTIMSGFPITLTANKRKADGMNSLFIEFPTEPTFEADAFYRLVLLPKAASPNIAIYVITPADDGSLLGMNAFSEGLNVAYTTFNGTPTLESHSWTDDATKRVSNFALNINKIDIGGSGGGRPEFRGCNL